MHTEPCPLCTCPKTSLFHRSSLKNLKRDYIRCQFCNLIFVPKIFHLSLTEQKERYLQHNNDPTDPKYREFLSRFSSELVPKLPPGSKGLDYGSGPEPALALLLKESGFAVDTYDLFFQRDKSVLSKSYNFVTCTETIEHFSQPRQEFRTLYSMLKPKGWLGIMTSMVTDISRFPDWYYHRDPTHIAFYSEKTMLFIADMFNLSIFFPRENVILFKNCDLD